MSGKRIIDYKNSVTPGMLDHLTSFVFDGKDIYEYEPNFTYNKGDLIWKFDEVNNRYIIYRCDFDGTTGPFDDTKWFILTFESRIEEKTQYTNPNPTLVDHGGIPAGSTFDKVDYDTLITRVLYPYIKPVVTVITKSEIVYEKGHVQSSLDLRYNLLSRSHKISKLEILENGNVIKTDVNPTDGDKMFTVTSISANKKYTIRITDEKKVNEYPFVNIYFENPSYYGLMDFVENPTQDQIKKLTKRLTRPNNNQRIDVAPCTKKMVVFAIPDTWDNIASIKDINTLELKTAVTVKNIDIRCLDGATVSYRLYISDTISPNNNLYFDYSF